MSRFLRIRIALAAVAEYGPAAGVVVLASDEAAVRWFSRKGYSLDVVFSKVSSSASSAETKGMRRPGNASIAPKRRQSEGRENVENIFHITGTLGRDLPVSH